MEEELLEWMFIWGLVALFLACVVVYESCRSLDDGWLGDFVKKRRQKEIESEEPEEPPFSLDKPNSCQYCKHNLCTGMSFKCDAHYHMNKRVETWCWTKTRSGFRTWDRCDDYEPLKACRTCKYDPAKNMVTETHIIGDEEVEVKLFPLCPYDSECKHAEKWEPKGGVNEMRSS